LTKSWTVRYIHYSKLSDSVSGYSLCRIGENWKPGRFCCVDRVEKLYFLPGFRLNDEGPAAKSTGIDLNHMIK
jgi:hypothetical protein